MQIIWSADQPIPLEHTWFGLQSDSGIRIDDVIVVCLC